MAFWGYTKLKVGELREDKIAEFKRGAAELGIQVVECFVEKSGEVMTALADLLTKAKPGDDVLVLSRADLPSQPPQAELIVLHEFHSRRIGVLDASRWSKPTDFRHLDLTLSQNRNLWHAVDWELLEQRRKFAALVQGRRWGRRRHIIFGQTPEQDAALKRILALHKHGLPYLRIAETLNNEGHKTLNGKSWHPQTVKNYVLRYGAEGQGSRNGNR